MRGGGGVQGDGGVERESGEWGGGKVRAGTAGERREGGMVPD